MRRQVFFLAFCQRAAAALRAMLRLLAAESAAALAFPPFRPPSFPNATAAGFFSFEGGPVTWVSVRKAASFSSSCGILERLGITEKGTCSREACQEQLLLY